jgi:hypothetical protein
VAVHRDVTESLAFLAGKIDQVTYDNLVCIGRPEVTSSYNAKTSQTYSNHSTIDEEVDMANRTLYEKSKRDYSRLFDSRTVY